MEEEITHPHLEKRPSIVSSTELATSPGGTKTLQVGLEKKEHQEHTSDEEVHKDVQEAASELQGYDEGDLREEGQGYDDPGEYDGYGGGGGVESFDWRDHVEAPDDTDEHLAQQLALDMERAMEEDTGIEEDSFNMLPQPEGVSEKSPERREEGEALIAEKDQQIEALQAQLMQALRGDASVVAEISAHESVDTRDAKIVALAKKNRNLNLALEKERDKSKSLEKSLAEASMEKKRLEARLAVAGERKASSVKERKDSDVSKALSDHQEKLAELQSKLDDARRKLESSKAEGKSLKRALAREVGEGPILDKLLNDIHTNAASEEEEFGSWRGRAQKIVLLQSKLKRAHAQLEKIQRMESVATTEGESVFGDDDGQRVSPLRSVKKKRSVDAKAEEDIRFIEQERRHAMERLAQEYEGLEEELRESKQVMNAVRARSKVLEDENKRYKEQVKILLNKTKNDDTLVDALRQEIDRLKREVKELKDRSKQVEKSTASSIAYEELKQHALSQSAQMERQNQLLVKMRAELERVKASASREIVDKAHEDINIQTHAVNSKLLRVENERLGELVELFKKKLEQAVLDREATVSKCKILERSKVELERRLGNIRSGGMKRQPSADQFTELRDKLALQIEENRAIRASAAQTVAQKDEEIRILREMGMEIKRTYENAIAEMKRQVAATAVEAQKKMSISETKIDDALLTQLTRDNEYLREELQDFRSRSTAAALSPSHSKSTTTLDSPQYRNRRHVKQQQSRIPSLRSSPRNPMLL